MEKPAMTLSRHAERYLSERRSRGELCADTVRNQRCHLRGLAVSFGARPVDRLSRNAIQRWQETIGHLSPASRRQQLSSVRTFCRWLVEHRIIRSDPTVGLASIRQPRSVPRALPGQSVAALLASVSDDPRALAIVWLMVGLGLRCCEVAHLEVSDYDPAGPTVTVRGKGGHERFLPVEPARARRAVDAYLVGTGVVPGPLIRSHREPWRGLQPDSISRLVARWMVDAGIKVRNRDGVSAHALRHSCASDVLDHCGDLRVVMEILGHQHLATTSIYLRRADLAQMRSAMSGRDYTTAA